MRERFLKECKKHGLTDHFMHSKRKVLVCYKCRNDSSRKHRNKNKENLVLAFGGKCLVCGYNKTYKALDFHHIDPENKSFGICRANGSKSVQQLTEEAAKCVLLCKNCHVEVEEGLVDLASFLKTPH